MGNSALCCVCKILITTFAILIFILSAQIVSAAIVHETVFIERVVDGDTLAAKDSTGKYFKIRLLGIQAPELFTEPPWALALVAKQELEKLVQQKKVTIFYVKEIKYDKYGRVLADIYTLNNQWVNGALIKNGFAYVYILNSAKIPKIQELKKLENKAIAQKLPFWQNSSYKVINPMVAGSYVSQFKVVDGTIYSIKHTKHSVWLMLTKDYEYGFSLRIKATDSQIFLQQLGVQSFASLKNKPIRVRGFIEKFNNNFGAFININSPDALDFQAK